MLRWEKNKELASLIIDEQKQRLVIERITELTRKNKFT
jgi:hypothetical protein